MTEVTFTELADGLYCIDTHLFRSNHTACYLLRHSDELAFFDTGATNNVPGLLEVTRQIGLNANAVRYVMPTHVHLDHAGGAGALMAACPNATLVTHHAGVAHMIDPSRLQAGATAVYGAAEFKRIFGLLTGIDENRVVAAYEGDRFDLGGQEILHIETPGHANHHGCFFDRESATLFTGDTFGLSYRQFDSDRGPWMIATTTPVAFNPEAWLDSLERMMALRPDAVCLTHFSRLSNPVALAPAVRDSVLAHRDIALNEETNDDTDRDKRLRSAVDALLVSEALRRRPDLDEATARELLLLDIELNAQGLHVWLKRRAKQHAKD